MKLSAYQHLLLRKIQSLDPGWFQPGSVRTGAREVKRTLATLVELGLLDVRAESKTNNVCYFKLRLEVLAEVEPETLEVEHLDAKDTT